MLGGTIVQAAYSDSEVVSIARVNVVVSNKEREPPWRVDVAVTAARLHAISGAISQLRRFRHASCCLADRVLSRAKLLNLHRRVLYIVRR